LIGVEEATYWSNEKVSLKFNLNFKKLVKKENFDCPKRFLNVELQNKL